MTGSWYQEKQFAEEPASTRMGQEGTCWDDHAEQRDSELLRAEWWEQAEAFQTMVAAALADALG